MRNFIVTAAFAASIGFASAEPSCSSTLVPANSVQPSVASGYRMQLVATGLSKPRGIEFDAAGNLLVVESGSGDLIALTFESNGGCVSVSDTNTVITGQGVSRRSAPFAAQKG
jgi:glucose/arabinose dehydrogenase